MATVQLPPIRFKSRPKRASIQLDMTPMVDLAFLLVTFFMLTTKFASDDPVAVHLPAATKAAICIFPESDLLTVLVSKDGRIFGDVDNQITRARLIEKIGTQYGISFSKLQVAAFSKMTSFGMDISHLPAYLNLSPEERKIITQPGIPADPNNNQLANWLIYARMVNPRIRVMIKCDEAVHYPLVKRIIGTLQDNGISRFGLVTDAEAE